MGENREPINLAELRAKAVEATPGPLRVRRYSHGGGRMTDEVTDRILVADFFDEGNREFYAACSPDAILRLVAALEEMRDFVEHMNSEKSEAILARHGIVLR